jgi:hypothetical protein
MTTTETPTGDTTMECTCFNLPADHRGDPVLDHDPGCPVRLIDLARRDRLRAELWASVNGSEADAGNASDPTTVAVAGAHAYRAGFSTRPISRAVRDQMTDELLAR